MAGEHKCQKCGHRSDYTWPWCSPYGDDWGKCLECGEPAPHRVAFDETLARAENAEERVRELEARIGAMRG